MPTVATKNEFIERLEKFTANGGNKNFECVFAGGRITIDETSADGAGEIYIDISRYAANGPVFFLKIKHCSVHNIGACQRHNDGIVLKVDMLNKTVDVLLFELKKQIRWNKVETAMMQLTQAYRFIRYIQLEACFTVRYSFYLAYETNNIAFDHMDAKLLNGLYQTKLYTSFIEQKDRIPLMIPLCSYELFPFRQLDFGETITV